LDAASSEGTDIFIYLKEAKRLSRISINQAKKTGVVS